MSCFTDVFLLYSPISTNMSISSISMLNETSKQLIRCVYVVRVCLHLTRIYKHRWMVSENAEHLSSSLTNSDCKSMSIRLTHDSECRLYFIFNSNMMPSASKTWPASDKPHIRDLAVPLMIKHELLFQLIALKESTPSEKNK